MQVPLVQISNEIVLPAPLTSASILNYLSTGTTWKVWHPLNIRTTGQCNSPLLVGEKLVGFLRTTPDAGDVVAVRIEWSCTERVESVESETVWKLEGRRVTLDSPEGAEDVGEDVFATIEYYLTPLAGGGVRFLRLFGCPAVFVAGSIEATTQREQGAMEKIKQVLVQQLS